MSAVRVTKCGVGASTVSSAAGETRSPFASCGTLVQFPVEWKDASGQGILRDWSYVEHVEHAPEAEMFRASVRELAHNGVWELWMWLRWIVQVLLLHDEKYTVVKMVVELPWSCERNAADRTSICNAAESILQQGLIIRSSARIPERSVNAVNNR